ERPEFVPQLERAIRCYRYRLLVRPGLTGLAQVQLPPDTDLFSVRRKLQYDLYYVERHSLLLDLQILLSTGPKVLGLPFSLAQRLFRTPGAEDVESLYHDYVIDPGAPSRTGRPAKDVGHKSDSGVTPSGAVKAS